MNKHILFSGNNAKIKPMTHLFTLLFRGHVALMKVKVGELTHTLIGEYVTEVHEDWWVN